MLNQLSHQYAAQIEAFQSLLLLVNALLHLLFAGAVARDASGLNRTGQRTAMASPTVWAFATLIGGVMTAAVYWFIHHSTLTRPLQREIHHE
jgi:ATP/ADP translocase